MPLLDHFKTSEIPFSTQDHQFSISLTRRTPRTDMESNPKMIWRSNKLQCPIAINSHFTKRLFRMVPKSRKKFSHQLMLVLGIHSCESPKKAAFPLQQVQNFSADFCTENSIPGGKHLLKYSHTKCDNNLSEI